MTKRYREYANTDPDRPLNARQELFVHHYLSGCSGSEAARRAGFSPTRAARTAHYLLTEHPGIQKAIEEGRDAIRRQTRYDAAEAMAELQSAIDFARKQRNSMAIVKAVELRAKLNGLLIDRQEVTTANIDVAAAMRQAGARLEGRSARAMAQINRTVGESPAPALGHDPDDRNPDDGHAADLAAHVAAGFEAVRADPADASDTPGSGVGELIDAGPAGGIFD